MVKRLRRESAVGKEEKAASGGKGFKGTKCAVVLTSALVVGGCAGDVTNEYNLPPIGQRSELCAEENVTLETQSKEVTVDVGQTFVFSNGYKMTLLDLEADTQTALFMLKDADGNELRNVDMEEGVDYIIEFPEGNVMVAACSVRAGYTLGESSATVRSDMDLTVEEEGPVDVVCESGLVIERWTNMYNVASSAMQEVEDQSCDNVVVRELSVFDPAIETESDASGAVKGLPQGRYKVLVLGEEYILASVGPESVELAKEAISGILNQGESVSVDNHTFRLVDLEAHGETTAAIISIEDSEGNIIRMERIEAGETVTFSIEGRLYPFHVYTVAPGYTFDAKWADIAIFAQLSEIGEGETFTPDTGGPYSGTYTFTMEWGPGNTIRGWEFRRNE